MRDRLECDDCGTLNVVTAKRCSLCGASLSEEAERRRAGDIRVILPMAVLGSLLWIGLLAGVVSWLGAFGEGDSYHLRRWYPWIWFAGLGALGLIVAALWRSAFEAWRHIKD